MLARLLLLIFVSTALVPAPAGANPLVPGSRAWETWRAADPASGERIDHAAWQALLDRYLVTDHPSGVNRFDYGAVSSADAAALDGYIASLAARDPRRYTRAEQFAYWINLYNALTVRLVVEHYPVRSIRRIHGGLFRRGPWDRKLVEIAGEELSLNDIEHRILRPLWQDPRIHYAVNCASVGCPDLAPRAYTAANTDALLDAGATAYVNHPRGVRFEAGRLELSSIYDWYGSDFGDDTRALLAHLARYADARLTERLSNFDGPIGYSYDWSLNAP